MSNRSPQSGETAWNGSEADHRKSKTQLVKELRNLRQEAADVVRSGDPEHGKKHMLFTLLDGVPDCIFFKDLDGTYSLINRALAIRLGLRHPSEALGQTSHDFFGREIADRFVQSEQDVIRNNEPVVDHEEEITWPDGYRSWMSITLLPLHDDQDEVIGLYGLARDVTRRRQTEQDLRDANVNLSDTLVRLKRTQQQVIQHERLSALGQMASGIAHSFNNALMPVLGYSDLLVENPGILDDDREEALQMLGDIRAAAKQAAETVKRLRDFYQPREHEGADPLDVVHVIRETLALTEPRWKEEMEAKGVLIKVEEQFEEVSAVMGDQGRLQEVFTNLIMNAVDAMPTGGVIAVSAGMDGRDVKVAVRDTGTGMPDEILRKCFEPFFTTKGVYGTGMGLSVAYGIVQQHRGTLSITSEQGQGTCVEIRLPTIATGAASGESRVTADTTAGVASRGVSLRVLVVDDDQASLAVVKACLEKAGHVVQTAESGEAGISACAEDGYDLVITDRAMPDMSGDQVALKVKELQSRVAVVMLTGFGDTMQGPNGAPEGVDLVISKPVTESGLSKAVACATGE